MIPILCKISSLWWFVSLYTCIQNGGYYPAKHTDQLDLKSQTKMQISTQNISWIRKICFSKKPSDIHPAVLFGLLLQTFIWLRKTHLAWSVQYSCSHFDYLHSSCDETVWIPLWRHSHSCFLLVEIKPSRIGGNFCNSETLLGKEEQSHWPENADFKSTSPFDSLPLESSDAQNYAPA